MEFIPPSRITLEADPVLGLALKGSELESCYTGDLVDGHRHGFGTYKYPNQFFVYEGEFIDGKKHGKGEFNLADGSVYEGEFADDEITGTGLRTWPDGSTYSGQFVEGERCGQGVHISAEGDKYEGAFEENRREGKGVMQYHTGEVLDCEWARNKPNGYGVWTNSAGDQYEGEFVDGLRQGSGEYTGADTTSYKGGWHAGKHHGEAVAFFAATGLSMETTFEEGAPAKQPNALLLQRQLVDPATNEPVEGMPAAITAGVTEFGGAQMIVQLPEEPPEEPPEGEEAPEGGEGGEPGATPTPPPPAEGEEEAPEDLREALWESGRTIAAYLHKGEPTVDEETQEPVLGERVEGGGVIGESATAKSVEGKVEFGMQMMISKEVEGGVYTLVFADATPAADYEMAPIKPCYFVVNVTACPEEEEAS